MLQIDLCSAHALLRLQRCDGFVQVQAVKQECGHEPLQYYWFRSAIKLYNSMMRSNGITVQKVLQADVSIHSREPSCWTAKVLDAFQRMRRCDVFVQAVRQSVPISIQEFTDNLKHRLWGVWGNVEGVDLQGSSNKLATEVHALLMCRDVGLCALRRKYAHLFNQFAGDFSVERSHLTHPVSAQAVSEHLLKYDNSLFGVVPVRGVAPRFAPFAKKARFGL